jgi:alpha-tubulin suppressor-like RCC1 family protein
VAAGTEHSLVVDVSGAVYSFGHGGFGTLGHGDEEIQFTPRVIEALRSVCVCAVDAGCAHNLVLGAGGEVYSFGFDAYGQLGHGSQANQPTPQVIKALKGIKVRAVAAGRLHSLVVSSAGEVYSFGNGTSGRLGHGDEQIQLTPKVIEALAGVKVREVAAGAGYSLVLSEDGVVYSFGDGEYGKLGHGDEEQQRTPKAIESLQSVKVSSIAAGEDTSLAVAVSGVAYGWGCGEDAKLGLGLAEDQLTPLQYPGELKCA